jgi:hypothetical protein
MLTNFLRQTFPAEPWQRSAPLPPAVLKRTYTLVGVEAL